MMNNKLAHYLLLAIVLILGVGNTIAQDLPKVLDPPLDFDKNEVKKLEKANELIKSAFDVWNRLVAEYNPKNATNYKIDSTYRARAYPLMVDAVKNFQDGNMMKFEVYRKNCASFWSKHKYDSPSGLENAKALQKEATNYFEKAQLNMQAAENYSNEYSKAFYSFHEAISLQIIAVKKEGRALQLYRDWPVHYNYVYDDDIVKNLFPKEPKQTEPIVAAVTEPEKKPEPQQQIPVEPEPEPYDSTVVYYQVQIGAHTVPLNSSYIKMHIYDGDMPVETLREEGWYKYVIGRYRTFDEANKLLKKVNIPKAFVVAYKNHKRVPIKEAETGRK